MLMLGSALVILLLGCAHLLITFRGPKLYPRDRELIVRLQQTPLVMTDETTVWKAWVGFNASHSLGAILFGLIYGYLSWTQAPLLFGSVFLLGLGAVFLAALAVLGWKYWFSVPFRGILLSSLLYVAAVAVRFS